MRRQRVQTGARYIATILLLITMVTVTNKNLSQMIVIGRYGGAPQPLVTKPSWCSKDYQTDRSPNHTRDIEDLLAMQPLPFEDGYKNPCFYDSCQYLGKLRVRKLRCLPYFHVLGVDKCGSTDLFTRIAKHPQVLSNQGVLGKETMWWSWRRYGHGLKHSRNISNFDQYLSYFDLSANEIQAIEDFGDIQTGTLPKHPLITGFWLVRNLTRLDTFDDYLSNFDNASSAFASHLLDTTDALRYPHPYVTGDGTPMDFWDFSGWPLIPQNKGLGEPKVLTPHLINHVNPNAKFVLIFREPAERLYSDYLFLGLGKSSSKSFHKKVEKSIVMFQKCKRQKSLRLCLFSRELHVTMPVRLYIGMYSTYLIEWLKVFPIQQFLFIRNEDYSKNIKGTLEEAFRFLNLEPLSNKTLEQISSSSRAHQTEKKKKAGKMAAKTRKLLKDFYAPFNRQLTALVNDLRFLWNDIK